VYGFTTSLRLHLLVGYRPRLHRRRRSPDARPSPHLVYGHSAPPPNSPQQARALVAPAPAPTGLCGRLASEVATPPRLSPARTDGLPSPCARGCGAASASVEQIVGVGAGVEAREIRRGRALPPLLLRGYHEDLCLCDDSSSPRNTRLPLVGVCF
jgi:hypothetical protein